MTFIPTHLHINIIAALNFHSDNHYSHWLSTISVRYGKETLLGHTHRSAPTLSPVTAISPIIAFNTIILSHYRTYTLTHLHTYSLRHLLT